MAFVRYNFRRESIGEHFLNVFVVILGAALRGCQSRNREGLCSPRELQDEEGNPTRDHETRGRRRKSVGGSP